MGQEEIELKAWTDQQCEVYNSEYEELFSKIVDVIDASNVIHPKLTSKKIIFVFILLLLGNFLIAWGEAPQWILNFVYGISIFVVVLYIVVRLNIRKIYWKKLNNYKNTIFQSAQETGRKMVVAGKGLRLKSFQINPGSLLGTVYTENFVGLVFAVPFAGGFSRRCLFMVLPIDNSEEIFGLLKARGIVRNPHG